MAKTLNDFLKECEAFPYSQENFDLIKEAAEINVAAAYVESQQYMLEHAGQFEGFDAGYMMESVGDESVKQLAQKAGGKKEKWAARAKNIWKRIVAAFKTFLNAIVKRYDKLHDKAADVMKNLGRVKITDEAVKEIEALVDRAVKETGIPISDKQKEGFKKLPRNIITISENTVKNKLAAACCNTTINLVINKPGQYSLALSESQLKDLFRLVSDKKVLAADADGLSKLKTFLSNSQTDNLKHGISISKSKEEIDELIESIKSAETKLAQDLNSNKPVDGNGGLGDVNMLFSNVQLCTSNSIKLYTCVTRYQKIVITGLDKIISKLGKQSPDTSAEAAKKDKENDKKGDEE